MTLTLRSRALALSAAVATIALTLVALPATPLAPASSALADSPTCTGYADVPNVRPGSDYPFPFTYGEDTEVGTYIAGDFTVVPGAAEGEGLIVVGENASFSTGEGFFLGVVGVGSQVSAPAGSDMLTVGGNVTVSGAGSYLDIGPNKGGNLRAGGTITPALPSSSYSFNGGAGFSSQPAVLAPYAAIPTEYTALSTQLEALATTGSTVDLSDPFAVHFIGDNTQTRQVFTVSGADLGSALTTGKDIHFDNMATDAVVVINVTGTVAEMNTWRFYVDGAELIHSSATDRIFSNWAQSVVWNFVDATDVTLGVNAQIPGAILIPTTSSELNLYSSVNGRLFVNGDVNFGGGGSGGIELHNYPMRECSLAPVDGTFTIGKTVSDPDAVTLSTRTYTGTYECLDTLGALVDDGTWSLEDGGTVTISGLPAGTECTATEDAATLTADPSATDPTYTWGSPTYSDTSVTVVAGSDVEITVTNVVLHDVGSLQITKALTDPDAVVPGTRSFTGTYSCVDSVPTVVASGTWSLAAGISTTIGGIPTGASCSIAEDASTLTAGPDSGDPSYTWGSPTYSSASVTITTGGTASLTVTNVVVHDVGSIQVDKVLVDPDAVVDPLRAFTGTISCTVGTPSPNTWSVTAAGAPVVFTGIPAGSTCTIAEDALTTAPSSTDSSYYWQPSTFLTPNVITVASGSTATVQVLNRVSRGLGDFEMVKILDDPYDVVDLSRVYTGTWSCTFNAVVIESGTWSTVAGAAPLSLATDLPAGTTCTLAEDASTLAAPPLVGFPQYIWNTPVIAPATVTILDGGLHRITVTNIVYDPIGELGHAGTESMGWLLLGTGVIAGGILLVHFGRRRRRA